MARSRSRTAAAVQSIVPSPVAKSTKASTSGTAAAIHHVRGVPRNMRSRPSRAHSRLSSDCGEPPSVRRGYRSRSPIASMGETLRSSPARRSRTLHPWGPASPTRRARKPDSPATRCNGEGRVRPMTAARAGGSSMTRHLIATISLSLSLAGVQSVALAQGTVAPVITTNTTGNCVTYGSPGDWTITCGDLNPGTGMTVIGSPSVDTVAIPADLAPAPAPEPAPVEAPAVETTVDAAATDATIASETDLDADNYPDALEVEVGLDPRNPDTDGDGVADGDEVNLYGTDPNTWDTDGDGVSDGGELFDPRTDPLVWNDFAVDGADTAPEEQAAAAEAPAVAGETPGDTAALAQASNEDLSATNGDAAALGNGNASSAPGTVTRSGVSATSLLGPDGTYRVTENSPPIVNVPSGTSVDIVPPAAREPVTDTTVDETSEPVATDTDGDGVIDSDEIEVYGTDPNTWDTDGDGLGDG